MEDVVSYLKSRGLFAESSSDQIKDFLKTPRVVYLGIDPTANSLHLGNLVGLIVLKAFQMYGHKIVVVMGGATAMIGDPSGTSKERPLLSKESIAENIVCIRKTVEHILHTKDKSNLPLILNNLDWYQGLSVIEYLRDIGKVFRLGPMLSKESVKARMESEEGISFTEFSYQTLQGNDFNHLLKFHNVELQIGGTDQYGNILAGIDFTRKVSSKTVYGLVFPLLTRTDGKKFGKSEKGAIWLNKDVFSPYQFYQHLIQFPDDGIFDLLKKLTFIPLDEIRKLEESNSKEKLPAFYVQKILASEVTRFVHGDQGLKEALIATDAINNRSLEIDLNTIKSAVGTLPSISLEKKKVVGTLYIDLLFQSGLLPSKGEARKLLKNNGAYLNKERIVDETLKIEENHLLDGTFLLLGSGKKKTLVVQVY